jgi:hypothetical protein
LNLKSVDFFFYGSLECWWWWCNVVVFMMMKKIKINLFLIFVYLNKINNMTNYNNWHGNYLFQITNAKSTSCHKWEWHIIKIDGDQKISLTFLIGGPKSWFWK